MYHAKRITEMLEYVWFLEANSDDVLVEDPSKWDVKDFNAWKRGDKPKINKAAQPNTGAGT